MKTESHIICTVLRNKRRNATRKEKNEMKVRTNKMKKCIALIDGELLCEDVLKAALDNRMMLDDLKKRLVEENPNHEVTFIYR